MNNKIPVLPVLPSPPVIHTMPLLAGFPPRLVGFQTSLQPRPTTLASSKEVPKAHVAVVPELCKGCELCVWSCPSGNLTLSDQLNRNGYHPVVFSFEGTRGPCSACGICYWICPDFSISEIRRLK